MKKTMRSLTVCFWIITLCSSLALAQTRMTNATVIKMTKAGLSSDIIVSVIESHPGDYATSPDDLIALKKSGVSEKVIAAMLAKSNGTSTVVAPSNNHVAPNPESPNRPSLSISKTPSGVVEAELENGDLKPARFAKIFVLPHQKAQTVKRVLFAVAQKLDDLRMAAVRQEGPNQPDSNLVEDACLKELIRIRLEFVTASIKASASPETAQNFVQFNANEEGKFQLEGIKSDSFNVIAVGKVGMNAAIWMSGAETVNDVHLIKLSQPIFSCFDPQGIFGS